MCRAVRMPARHRGCVDSQGDAYFVAPNPDFGATFTYYLADSLMSRKDQRRDAEKELEADNEDVAFADWDDLRAERLEDAPAILFTVSDLSGNVIRRFDGPHGGRFSSGYLGPSVSGAASVST